MEEEMATEMVELVMSIVAIDIFLFFFYISHITASIDGMCALLFSSSFFFVQSSRYPLTTKMTLYC